MTGSTSSQDFPVLHQLQEYQGGGDAFIVCLNTNLSGLSSLIYSTYLGGESSDVGRGIAVDNNKNVFVTGYTSSSDFPIMNSYQEHYGGGMWDAFVTRLYMTQNGSLNLIYSTFQGGSGNDYGHGIAVDKKGNAFVTGYTCCSDFPVLHPFQEHLYGFSDAFVTWMDTNLNGASSLIYSTYLGASKTDDGDSIALDNKGNVYITGSTRGINFPTVNPFQEIQSLADAFVAKFTSITLPIVVTEPVSNITTNSAASGGKVVSDGNAPVTARGVCWSTFPRPTIKNNLTKDGKGIGKYTSHITGLIPNTTYYVRAYATNSVGTAYGRNLSFKTKRNPAISGRVTNPSGTAVPAVNLYFSNNSGTIKTNQEGFYKRVVPYNWSGVVIPTKPGYVFIPLKRAYNKVTTEQTNQDFTAYHFVLSLNASRETESAWLIRRQYGKLSLMISNPDHIPVVKYIIYRKTSGRDYSLLAEVPGSQLQEGLYLYYDRYLDKDKTYTYKFTAVDAKGVIMAGSNEKTI